MANAAAVSAVEFISGDPGFFGYTATSTYYDDQGGTTFALISGQIQIGDGPSGYNNEIINKTVAAAPPGFEVTGPDILFPAYTSG